MYIVTSVYQQKMKNAKKHWNIDDLSEVFHMTDQNYQFSYYIIHYYSFPIHKVVLTLVQLISHLSTQKRWPTTDGKIFPFGPRINWCMIVIAYELLNVILISLKPSIKFYLQISKLNAKWNFCIFVMCNYLINLIKNSC